MDEKRNRKRFNVIDLLIVLLVLGAIAALIIRSNIYESLVFDNQRDKVEISFVASGISPEIANAVSDGEEYYIDKTDLSIGRLKSHQISDAKIIYSNDLGNPVVGSDKTKRDIYGVLDAGGVMSDEGFMLDGLNFICAGKSLTISSLNGQFSVVITEIRPLEE